MQIDNKLASLPGVGPKIEAKLNKYGINTMLDLVYHLPKSYQDKSRITPILYLEPNTLAQVKGTIVKTQKLFGKKAKFLVEVSDASGSFKFVLFNFNKFVIEKIEIGAQYLIFGEVKNTPWGKAMFHPEYSRVSDDIILPATLSPIYSTPEKVSPKIIARLVNIAVNKFNVKTPEFLPKLIIEKYNLPSYDNAIRFIHNPDVDVSLKLLEEKEHPAQIRLIFEELLAHNIAMRTKRLNDKQYNAFDLSKGFAKAHEFINNLEFELTTDQKKVSDTILQDLSREYPMARLVQGDVGCGKTIVAAVAAIAAAGANFQAAIMAPTEILANQTYQKINDWCQRLNISCELLTGKLTAKQKRESYDRISQHKTDIVIGTHALFQEKIEFAKLALVVIDEQHRFGVKQRLNLREKGLNNNYLPHQLLLTATPIPRTLAQTIYANVDTSFIKTMPPNRKAIKTAAISSNNRDEIISKIKTVCQDGAQVYWVCPLIEESEILEYEPAIVTFENLKSTLNDLNIALIHGKLKNQEKEDTMQAFKSGDINVLVATTVIEVGVDVPNASLMIIENAEKFGLAQLHQLRGRVGRGNKESFCLLLYNSPLSATAKKRLDIMRKTTDGFKISEVDLELRGPGEVLGTMQTGSINFKLASLIKNQDMIEDVIEVADSMLAEKSPGIEYLTERYLGEKINFKTV